MKRSSISILPVFLLLFCISNFAQAYNTKLIPYRRGDKWGYCDVSKKVIIPTQFSEAHFFEGLLATVSLDSDYCVINQDGDILYKTRSYAVILKDGRHFIGGDNSYTARVYNAQGKPVSKVYNTIERGQYGYYFITANYTKEGLLDSTFREVVPPVYGSIEFLSRDLLKIYDDKNLYGLLDLKTAKIFASGYDKIYAPNEGRIMVCKSDQYGFLDMDGKPVSRFSYFKETPENISRYDPYNESNYQSYDVDGFYCGLAVVVDNDKAGYVNKKDEIVIELQFDKAFGFKAGFAWVQKNGKWGMINTRGAYVLQPIYRSPVFTSSKELLYLEGFHDGLVAVAIDSLYGYFDTTGKMVIPFQYQNAEPFYEGMAAVTQGGKIGFINKKGEWVISPQYKAVEGAGVVNTHPFEDGCAIAQEMDGRWSIIDKKGRPLMQLKFDADNKIWFNNNIADAAANGKRYVFTNKGEILRSVDDDGFVSYYFDDIFYNYKDKYYFNSKTKVKYLF